MSQPLHRVEKPWGYEVWWARTDRYVGKQIHINKGHALSLQYHNKKDETIFLWAGRMLFEIKEGDELVKQRDRIGEAIGELEATRGIRKDRVIGWAFRRGHSHNRAADRRPQGADVRERDDEAVEPRRDRLVDQADLGNADAFVDAGGVALRRLPVEPSRDRH